MTDSGICHWLCSLFPWGIARYSLLRPPPLPPPPFFLRAIDAAAAAAPTATATAYLWPLACFVFASNNHQLFGVQFWFVFHIVQSWGCGGSTLFVTRGNRRVGRDGCVGMFERVPLGVPLFRFLSPVLSGGERRRWCRVETNVPMPSEVIPTS